MAFCCGASMIGAQGTLKHVETRIHNVPLLYCPICQKVDVHHSAEYEFEILAEYANGDGATEINFLEYVKPKDINMLYENCVNHEDEDPSLIIQTQIDMALDLLMFAKQLQDQDWEEELTNRLTTLSRRRKKLEKKRSSEATG